MTNTIFQLISRGLTVPEGYGFPIFPKDVSEISANVKLLRDLLLPLSDPDSLAQLFRWHHGIIVATRSVFRGIIGEDDCYESGDIYLAPIASLVPVVPDPRGGFYKLGWTWAGETPTLSSRFTLTAPSTYRLTFDNLAFTGQAHQHEQSDTRVIDWPEFMKCSAALHVDSTNWVAGFATDLKFRVPGFDGAYLLSRMRTEHSRVLADANLLDTYGSAVSDIDKIAIIWLAIAILESA